MSDGRFRGTRLRQVLLAVSVAFVLAYPPQVPPDLSEGAIRSAEGVYRCRSSPGKNPSASETIGHVRYASHFSFVFGYSSPSGCFDELNGRMVVVRFVETPSPNPPLLLSLQDSNTGSVWGRTEADRLQQLRDYLAQTWWFRVSQGVAILVLVLLFYPRLVLSGFAAIGRITRFGARS